jgi:hypothetical protein
MTGKQISFLEASELEIDRVLRKYEVRTMIAIEGARRDAIRNGRNEINTIQQDEQLLTMLKEIVEAASRAGIGWLAIARAFTRTKGSAFENEATDIDSRIQQHRALARAKTGDWLISLVVRLVPGVRLIGAP